MLQRYRDWAPTQFDTKGLAIDTDDDRSEWYVAPCLLTRDSDPLEESNWEAQRALLTAAGCEFEVHRFGHWAVGWFEICLVAPTPVGEQMLTRIADKLESYPILDEDDLSWREWEAASDYWHHASRRERIRLCAEASVSIFAARRDTIPQEDDGSIFEACLGR